MGRDERTRVLAALGAGLTRELHPVFATLLGREQLLLARAPDDPLREGLVALEEAAWRGTDLLQRLLGLAEADQRGAVAELPAIAQEAVSFARARLRAEPGSRGAIEMTLPCRGPRKTGRSANSGLITVISRLVQRRALALCLIHVNYL